MKPRLPVAVAALLTAGLPLHLDAQRGTVAVQTGRPIHVRPGPRPMMPSPTVRGGIIIVPAPGGQRHRPIYFRSSIFGLVALDPYWWAAPDVAYEIPVVPPQPGPILSGGLQLDVEPRRAFVYVDGVFAGRVDQFKGYFQHLEIGAGYHVIELVSPDYEPLVAAVTVVPNQTTTYRAFLNRATSR